MTQPPPSGTIRKARDRSRDITAGRLSPEAWISAGFRALATKGPPALKAEVLSREVGTTKGSFYWHFADIADFKARMLQHWEARSFEAVIEEMEAIASPPLRLRQLCALAVSFRDPAYGGRAAEPALRAWAREDANVAAAVTRMDARRLAYLEALCIACGLKQPEAAAILYAASLGYESLLDGTPERAVQGMMALLDALGLPQD